MKTDTVLLIAGAAAVYFLFLGKKETAAAGATTPTKDITGQGNVLMEHPTQGRAWIPAAVVAQYLPPIGEWKIV